MLEEILGGYSSLQAKKKALCGNLQKEEKTKCESEAGEGGKELTQAAFANQENHARSADKVDEGGEKIDEVAEAVAKPEAEDLTLVPSSANIEASMLMLKEDHKHPGEHKPAPAPAPAMDPGPMFDAGPAKEDHFGRYIKSIPVGPACCQLAQMECAALAVAHEHGDVAHNVASKEHHEDDQFHCMNLAATHCNDVKTCSALFCSMNATTYDLEYMSGMGIYRDENSPDFTNFSWMEILEPCKPAAPTSFVESVKKTTGVKAFAELKSSVPEDSEVEEPEEVQNVLHGTGHMPYKPVRATMPMPNDSPMQIVKTYLQSMKDNGGEEMVGQLGTNARAIEHNDQGDQRIWEGDAMEKKLLRISRNTDAVSVGENYDETQERLESDGSQVTLHGRVNTTKGWMPMEAVFTVGGDGLIETIETWVGGTKPKNSGKVVKHSNSSLLCTMRKKPVRSPYGINTLKSHSKQTKHTTSCEEEPPTKQLYMHHPSWLPA